MSQRPGKPDHAAGLEHHEHKGTGRQLVGPERSNPVASFSNLQSEGGDAEVLGPNSKFTADQANANVDYTLQPEGPVSVKYYYQNDPTRHHSPKVPCWASPTIQARNQTVSLPTIHCFVAEHDMGATRWLCSGEGILDDRPVSVPGFDRCHHSGYRLVSRHQPRERV